jgi:hypothetical protein
MLSHHIATLGLIGLSFLQGYKRIGLVVLFLHDASDVPTDLLKLTNYLKLEGPASFFCVEAAFALNLATWFWYRIVLLPKNVVLPVARLWRCHIAVTGNTFEDSGTSFLFSRPIIANDGTDSVCRGILDNSEDRPRKTEAFLATLVGAAALLLLSALVAMHIYWFCLFLRILRGILAEGAHEAGRKEYEGDDIDEAEERLSKKKKDPLKETFYAQSN